MTVQRWRAALSLLLPVGVLSMAWSTPPTTNAPRKLSYRTEVRPILARSCFGCHGQDDKKRSAGLRLDQPNRAVVAGDVLASKLIQRVFAPKGDARQMPPVETGHTLTESEKLALVQWIDSGARYEGHWAFQKITPRSGSIDSFIQSKLNEKKLTLSPEADRFVLLRRLSLDLIGLPPTPTEIAAFAADRSPTAYEKQVDRLLASPHFGEKWARPWLDLARFADSAGYGSDPLRPNLWPYRDWVIDALNKNMPFDRFTVEQLAGDLLPNPTQSQLVATAFHRNTMTNTEGGTDREEFRTAAVKDRTIVTMQAWMGLTFQCAQCHTHKFDPIPQRDFYSLMAFFNQTEDNDQPDERPTLPVLSSSDLARKAHIKAELKTLEAEAAKASTAPNTTLPVARFVRVSLPGAEQFLMLAEVEVMSGGKNVARLGKATQSTTDYGGDAMRAIDGSTDGTFNNGSVTHTASQSDPWWEVDLGADYPIGAVTLWTRTDTHVGKYRNFTVSLSDATRKPVFSQAPPPSTGVSVRVGLTDSPALRALLAKRAELATIQSIPLPILRELPNDKRRTTHLLTLGNFLLPEAPVEAATPSAFFAMPTRFPKNRLGLAQWIVAKENPLTARVAVNRFWAQLFGVGIVETEEDFGTQGAAPTHPELLDMLAASFQRDWDVKKLLKTIVMSRTYRQSSKVLPEHLARDPRNQWLARYPRRRLDAEGIRDQALALSGLLSHKLGGPSVFPPQPAGLWQAAFNGDRSYPTSMGEDRYRRGLYTFWRRTVPYPSMQTFDAPSREFCTLRRQPTNTPLQALVTLNDPVYLELAQALGKRIEREGGTTPTQRARFGLTLALCRPPTESQIETLVKLFESEKAHFAKAPMEAKQLSGTESADAAAWTVVGNVLLNLDGVLTKG